MTARRPQHTALDNGSSLAPEPLMIVSRIALAAAAAGLLGTAASAQDFHTVKPSTTGVPGTEVRVQTFDAEGNLWVAGRWPFWGESGLAMLPVSEHPHSPIASGFDTGLWQVWSSVHHPIPSPFIDAVQFTSDGIMWLGSDGGLTRFGAQQHEQPAILDQSLVGKKTWRLIHI